MLLADLANFRTHFQAQLGIQIGEWLIQQQALGADHQRARQGYALLLPTGELLDFAGAEAVQLYLLQCLRHSVLDLLAWALPLLQAEGHVLRYVEVWPQGVALKHHARAALVRWQPRHVLIIKPDLARIWRVEARDVAEQGGLATAAGPQQEEQLPGVDLQVHAAQYNTAAESFGEFLDCDRDHADKLRFYLRGRAMASFADILTRKQHRSCKACRSVQNARPLANRQPPQSGTAGENVKPRSGCSSAW